MHLTRTIRGVFFYDIPMWKMDTVYAEIETVNSTTAGCFLPLIISILILKWIIKISFLKHFTLYIRLGAGGLEEKKRI